jgi:drug/metabolite transporter (DMT)-like permease
MARSTATLIGFIAILLWATLAALTAASGKVPPFQLAAFSFVVAFAIGLAAAKGAGRSLAPALKQRWTVWALGVGGLFGYHFFYFMALRNAPPVEASLIAYLWPLLIVVFSALLPGERLGWHHLVGALAGMLGAALLVTGGNIGDLASFRAEYATGYGFAVACALTWSSYSVLSRRVGDVRTDAVTGFCGVTAVLATLCHLAFETTVWPADTVEWLAVLGLGLGPVGGAFYVWDIGVKRGDIQLLGVLSYAAPLLSTLLLVALGLAQATWVVGLACLLITGGAALAAKNMIPYRLRRLGGQA